MTRSCEDFQPDWDLFVLGTLDSARRAEIEEHLRSDCRHCRRRLAEAHVSVSALGTLAPPVAAPADVERRLAQRLDRSERKIAVVAGGRPARRRPAVLPWLAAAACLALAVWLAVDRSRLQTELIAAREEIASPAPAVTIPASTPPPAPTSSPTPASTAPAMPRALPPNPAASVELDSLRARVDDLNRTVDELRAARAAAEHEVARLQTVIAEQNARGESLQRRLAQADSSLRPPADDRTREDRTRLVALNQELQQTRAELARQNRQMAEMRSVLRILDSGSVKQVELAGVDPAAGRATARAIWSPDGGLLLLARDLPRLPSDKCYQLWVIRKNAPAVTSAGLLNLDAQGRGILYFPAGATLNGVTGLAITDEPEGGSIAARGKKLLFGAAL